MEHVPTTASIWEGPNRLPEVVDLEASSTLNSNLVQCTTLRDAHY
jgi:hypothetical protein